jgi:hypothetical protein
MVGGPLGPTQNMRHHVCRLLRLRLKSGHLKVPVVCAISKALILQGYPVHKLDLGANSSRELMSLAGNGAPP